MSGRLPLTMHKFGQGGADRVAVLLANGFAAAGKPTGSRKRDLARGLFARRYGMQMAIESHLAALAPLFAGRPRDGRI